MKRLATYSPFRVRQVEQQVHTVGMGWGTISDIPPALVNREVLGHCGNPWMLDRVLPGKWVSAETPKVGLDYLIFHFFSGAI